MRIPWRITFWDVNTLVDMYVENFNLEKMITMIQFSPLSIPSFSFSTFSFFAHVVNVVVVRNSSKICVNLFVN